MPRPRAQEAQEQRLNAKEISLAAARWLLIKARAQVVAREFGINVVTEDVIGVIPNGGFIIIEVKCAWHDYIREWDKTKWRWYPPESLDKTGPDGFYFIAQKPLSERIANDIKSRNLRIGVLSLPKNCDPIHGLYAYNVTALIRRKHTKLNHLDTIRNQALPKIAHRLSMEMVGLSEKIVKEARTKRDGLRRGPGRYR